VAAVRWHCKMAAFDRVTKEVHRISRGNPGAVTALSKTLCLFTDETLSVFFRLHNIFATARKHEHVWPICLGGLQTSRIRRSGQGESLFTAGPVVSFGTSCKIGVKLLFERLSSLCTQCSSERQSRTKSTMMRFWRR
jgi:hypothetical protein